MGSRGLAFVVVMLLPAVWAEDKKPPQDPRVSTISPLTGQAGTTYTAAIRGTVLARSQSLQFSGTGVRARVLRVEPDLVHVEMSLDAEAAPGDHAFRVLTADGITNQISMRVARNRVVAETDVTDTLERFPTVVTGRIASRGETDSYWIRAETGQTLTFEAFSVHAPFDPVIGLYEASGSWFDSQRLNQIAFNDEPLFFPGLSTNARLVHRFEKGGRYCVKLQAFSGQGGPDFVYELRVSPGTTSPPPLHPKQTGWEERQFTRRLLSDWLNRLSRRGGPAENSATPEIYRAAIEGSRDVPVITAPGVVEGVLTSPAEAHVIKLKIDQPQNLVIEIETPKATLPQFNPVVRLMEPGGTEIATNVYTKLNNNGLYMMKMIQAKTAVPLRAPGEYFMQIRDITTDRAGTDFAYRVLVRPQIPHIGKIVVSEDSINIQPGATKTLTVVIEREEDFAGHVALSVAGLPPGITAVTGVPNPLEKPPLPNGGKLERYTAKTQNAALLLVASPEILASTTPVVILVIARALVKGEFGEQIVVKEIPLMVVERRPS
jgi:hypothetical protein